MLASRTSLAARSAWIVTFACAISGLVGQAKGQTAEIISSYTSTAERACKTVDGKGDRNDDGFVHVCPGIGNLIVLNSEGDLRETVSVGRTRAAAAKEPAALHWFGPFSSTTSTIEWRHRKGGTPFAIIQR